MAMMCLGSLRSVAVATIVIGLNRDSTAVPRTVLWWKTCHWLQQELFASLLKQVLGSFTCMSSGAVFHFGIECLTLAKLV